MSLCGSQDESILHGTLIQDFQSVNILTKGSVECFEYNYEAQEKYKCYLYHVGMSRSQIHTQIYAYLIQCTLFKFYFCIFIMNSYSYLKFFP